MPEDKKKKPLRKLKKPTQNCDDRDFLGDAATHIKERPRAFKKSRNTPQLPQHIRDAQTLTATELREKYRSTYSSWTNMKSRSNSHGAVIAPEFEKFSSFLMEMGPRPNKDYTLDRIDNDNPTYGPGLCVWATKKAQANNRSTTHILEHEGERLPLTEWAARTGQNPSTLRGRKYRGWSDKETITGERLEAEFGRNPLNYKPWKNYPEDELEKWDDVYETSYSQDRFDFVIQRLKSEAEKLEEFLQENYPIPSAAHVCKEKQKRLDYLRKRLELLEEQYVKWKRAVKLYRRKLGQ